MRMHPKHADEPMGVRKSRVIAAQFMGDLGRAPLDLQDDVFWTMRLAKWHQFLVLTKWPENITENVPDNCWIGTTVTDQVTAGLRIPKLLAVKAAHKWVSVEPMLGPVDMGTWLPELSFVACGPETGTGAAGYTFTWMIDVADQCWHTAAPFYDKRDHGSIYFLGQEWPEEWKR